MTYQIPQGDADFLTRLFGPQMPPDLAAEIAESKFGLTLKDPTDDMCGVAVNVLKDIALSKPLGMVLGWSTSTGDDGALCIEVHTE